MDQIFTFFNQGWVGSVIGMLGVVLGVFGIYSYKIAKSAPKPCYQQFAHVLLGGMEDDLPSEVSIKYGDDDVKKLTRTSIIFWNHGTEILNGEDIVLSDPLRLEFPDGAKVLSSKVIKNIKNSNEFTLRVDEGKENILYLSYVYLDPKDGVSIEILHNSEDKYPDFKGVIKGVPKGVLNLSLDSATENKISFYSIFEILYKLVKNKYAFYFFFLMAGLVSILLGLILMFYPDLRQTGIAIKRTVNPGVPVFLSGVIYLTLAFLFFWSRRVKYPKALKLNR